MFIPISILLLGLVLVTGCVAGIAALAGGAKVRRELESAKRKMAGLEARIADIEAHIVTAGMEPLDLEVEEDRPEPAAPQSVQFPPPTEPAATDTIADEPPTAQAQPQTPPQVRVDSPQGPPETSRWSSFEEKAGKKWMTWAGALALFISAGFFLKYAFDNQWIGPTGRVALGIAAGLAMLALGEMWLTRRMRALGQGVMGGGLAILYVSLFAAFSLYKLIPQAPAFGAMVLVTAAGMTLAVRHNATPLGFIAVLGGFISPLLVATGEDPRDALFCYLAILDVGVLGASFFRKWRALDVVAFLGTWALFTGWFLEFYRSSALVPTGLWVAGFFVIFLLVPFAYQIRTRSVSTLESFTLALANAAASFGYLYWILRDDYRHTLGFVALGMTACYVALSGVFRRRIADDARSLFGFVALAVTFLTLAIPLHLKVQGITLTWAVEGPILLYLGYKFSYRPLRVVAALVIVLAAGRLFFVHWPLHKELFILFFNKQFASAMSVPIAAAAYAIFHSRMRSDSTELDRKLMIASALLAGFLTLAVTHGELWKWLELHAEGHRVSRHYYLAASGTTALWAVGAIGFLAAALFWKSEPAFYAGLAALIVASFLCGFSYGMDGSSKRLLFINVRFVAGLLTALVWVVFALVARGRGGLFDDRPHVLSTALFIVAGLAPLFLLSAEVYTFCHDTVRSRKRARWSAQMGLSIVWGTYAVGGLVLGFRRRIKELRLASLGLMGLVSLKLVLIDLARLGQIYRILSFVVLGLLMILASYLYHRLDSRLHDTG